MWQFQLFYGEWKRKFIPHGVTVRNKEVKFFTRNIYVSLHLKSNAGFQIEIRCRAHSLFLIPLMHFRLPLLERTLNLKFRLIYRSICAF